MERVIDRKEYRRSSYMDKTIGDEQIDILQSKIRKFLYQSLIAALLLLCISFLRFYNCVDILEKLKLCLNNEITISSLQKSGQIIFDESVKYYTELNNFVNQVMTDNFDSQNLNIENLSLIKDNIESGEYTLISGELLNIISSDMTQANDLGTSYESAVEGINQMSDDAKYIKENYKMTVPVIGTITSEFGVRNSLNPIVSSYHCGLDIAANTGTEVIAALDGEVIEATTDAYFGKYIKMKKDDIVMIYAHCSKLLVKVGDKVKKGNLIAYVGNTGNSTGPHLHFELKYKDRLVNPLDILELEV